MIRSIAVLSVLASAVVAQSSTSTSSTPAQTQNAFIPQGISAGCTTFLTALNANASLASCVKPISDTVAQFGPGGNSSATPSLDAVNAALAALSSFPAACDAAVRAQLAEFTKACPAELTGPTANAAVVTQYDVLYVLTPMRQAVVAKDDSGKFCATQISSGGTAGSKLVEQDKQPFDVASLYSDASSSSSPLVRRQERTVTQNNSLALVPNTTTFRNAGVAFLFLTPTTDAANLCTPCTRNVFTPYMTFEQLVPYVPGIPNSPILGGQQELYQAIIATCGAQFMSGAVQAAGGLANGNPFSTSGAMGRVEVSQAGVAGTLFAAVAAAFAALL